VTDRPKPGARFIHSRHLAPEGTKANPVYQEEVVVAVRRGEVYYTSAKSYDAGRRHGSWRIGLEKFAEEVGEWIDPEPEAGQ
jgi:hypothetical protein